MKKMYKKLSIAVFLLATSIGLASAQSFHSGDITALMTIRSQNMDNTSLFNWDTETDPLNWTGVSWDGSNPRRVTSLNFDNDQMKGKIDFTPFDSITYIDVDNNINLKGVMLTGLNNLQWFYGDDCSMTSFDASGLPSLQYVDIDDNLTLTKVDISGDTSIYQIRARDCALTSIDATGCINLDKLSIRNNNLTSFANVKIDSCLILRSIGLKQNKLTGKVDVSGLPNLQNMKLGRDNMVTSLDVTGDTSLYRLKVGRDNMQSSGGFTPNVTGIDDIKKTLNQLHLGGVTYSNLDVSGFTALYNLRIRKSGEGGSLKSLNVTGDTTLYELRAGKNSLEEIIGYGDLKNIYRVAIDKNSLDLTTTVQLDEQPGATYKSNYDMDNAYDYQELTLGQSIDFSAEDSVDVNGTNVGTTFEFYDALQDTLITTNTTGIFTPSMNGAYYVILMNSGNTVKTKLIVVGQATPDPSFSSDDYDVLMGIYDNNMISPNVNWKVVSDLTQMDGVSWDNGTPRRVTALKMPHPTANGGGNCNCNVTNRVELTGSLDLRDLTMLEDVAVPRQRGLSNIRFDNLANLDYVVVGRTTGLSSLDFSDLPSLYRVRGRRTGAVEMDASNTANLYELSMNDAALEEMDLDGSDVDRVYCDDCNLQGTLDARNLSDLYRMYVGDNNLLKVRVSGSANLYYLRTERNPALYDIDFGGNTNLYYLDADDDWGLKSVDFDEIPNLYSLYADEVPFNGNLVLEDMDNLRYVYIDNENRQGLTSISYVDCDRLSYVYHRGAQIKELSVTGKHMLYRLRATRGELEKVDFTGMEPYLNNGFQLHLSNNSISEVVGIADLDTITGETWDFGDRAGGIHDNNLTISEASEFENKVDFANYPAIEWNKQGDGVTDQADDHFIEHGLENLIVPATIDFSADQVNTIWGVEDTTTFSLVGPAPQSNNTGIFTIGTNAEAGSYYVSFVNSYINDVKTYNFTVGDSTSAAISIPDLNFGKVHPGLSSTLALTISNNGLDTLKITDMTVPTGFSFSDTAATILGGQSANINVTFSPTEHKNYNNSSFVFCNAASGNVIFNLYAQGYDSTTSVQDDMNTAISLYPNPTTGMIYIDGYKGQVEQLNVYDVNGALLQTVNLKESQAVDLRRYPAGMYFLRSSEGEISEKFVKQ